MDTRRIAAQFALEILEKRKRGGRWSWEHYINGPISDAQTREIESLVGCWCYDNDADAVRFYTNSNHPRWR